MSDFFFQKIVITHCCAALNAAHFGDHAGAVEHGLNESGLPAGTVPDQG